MGATRRSLMNIFRHHRLHCRRAGDGRRTILGFGFLYFRQPIVRLVEIVTGQNLWDPSIRFLTELPSLPTAEAVMVICLMALGFSFLATLYPAWRAASTDPVQVLRYE